jgi:gas vesicle protein
MTQQDSTSNLSNPIQPRTGANAGSSTTSGDPMAQTKEKGDKLRQTASGVMDDVRDLASTAADEGKSYARSAASDASSAFRDAVESNKTAGADAVANLARSAKSAADGIEGQSPQIARIVRSTAEGVEKLSTDVRDRSVGELLDSVTDFAKRQPAAFFGCGILAGLVLSRMMRSSDR